MRSSFFPFNFVIVVETDGVYEAIEIPDQSFKISPKKVNVDWQDLEQEYTGDVSNPLKPTASYTTVDSQAIELTVNAESDMINAGTYAVSVNSPDSNYQFINPNASFVITKKKIDEPVIQTDMVFAFGDEIKVKDIYGNIYELDTDGTILSITYIGDPSDPDDDIIDNDIDLPYKIILSPDTNADGVKVDNHTLSVVLNDPDNYQWSNKLNSNNLEIDYVITPKPANGLVDDPSGPSSEPDPSAPTSSVYEVSIVLEGKTFEYTGEEIRPALTVSIRDYYTKEIVEVLYNESDTSIPSDKIAGYRVTYYNNIEITPAGSYATIKIEGINNYSFSETREFSILANAPELLTLVDNSTIKFIKVNNTFFSGGGMSTSFELDGVTRTESYQEDTYLGHLHQDTYISTVLDQIANELGLIKVYNASGELVTSDRYETEFFGTGYKIVLHDKNTMAEIDSIESILFGDINGDGSINVIDIGFYRDILAGNSNFDTLGIKYFAAFTDQSQITPNVASFGLIRAYLTNSNDDFNVNYLVR